MVDTIYMKKQAMRVGLLLCGLVIARGDVVKYIGRTDEIVEAPGVFSCRVALDWGAFSGQSTASAQLSVPMKIEGDGEVGMRVFVLDAAGTEEFVAANNPGPAGPAIFNVTDFINEHPRLRRATFVIRAVMRPLSTVRLAADDGPSLALNTEGQPRYPLRDMLAPMWAGPEMVNETVLPVAREGEAAEGRLLFAPVGSPVVRNYALDKTYVAGVDYLIKGNAVVLTGSSAIPFFSEKQLYPESAEAGVPTKETWNGGYLAFSEGPFFNDRQITVTYQHRDDWNGPIPAAGTGRLPRTKETLRKGSPLKVVLFGDSISVGASASGRAGKPPFVPGWGDLLISGLRQRHASKITFVNSSKGGGNTEWGLKVAPYMVVPEKPDLCIIAFGINDGNRLPVEKYLANTRKLIELVREERPDAEFILVASMLKNERWRPLSPMNQYLAALKTLESEQIAVADVWSMSEFILKTKRYCDVSGNHVNHPNDFMVRVYAQTVSALLGLK